MGIPDRDRERMIESIYALAERYDVMTNSSNKTRFIYNIYSVYWCDFNDYIHTHKCEQCELCVIDNSRSGIRCNTFCDSLGALRRVLR